MLKAARRYGMKAKGLKVELEVLAQLPCPYIVFWRFNHFVVVEGITAARVYLNDPACGRRTVSYQEFDEGFTGVVLALEPGEGFEPGGRRPSVVAALRSRLRGSYAALLYCVLAGLLLTIPGLAMPILGQVFIDYVLIQGHEAWLRPILTGIVATVAVSALLTHLQLGRLRNLNLKLSLGLSGRFLWHVLRLPLSFYAQRFAGEISGRVALNQRVADVLSGQLASTIIDCAMLFLYGVVMLQYDVALTVVGLLFTLVNVFALRFVSGLRIAQALKIRNEAGKLGGIAVAGLQSIETIKSSAEEDAFFARWAGHYAKNVNAQQKLALADHLLGLVPGLLAAIVSLLMVVVGGLRVMDGQLTLGALVAFQAMMGRFQGPVGTLVALGTTLQTLDADMQRLDDALRHPLDPVHVREAEDSAHPEPGAPRPSPAAQARPGGQVELRGVSFGYSRVAPPIIEGLDLRVEPGGVVALVGASGSGKSTVARLIAGLHEPWDGEILLDERARAEWPRRAITERLALVDQDILLFAGTVRDNLTLWDATVSDEEIVRACEAAAIDDVVRGLPGGLDAELLEGGANLSGGQRQRLEIARALVQNPAVLVLDEATSALDAETEHVIDRNLRRWGCSRIVVAHRLSTIRDADEIVVLKQGRVVERGVHADLWAAGGEYARLLNSTATGAGEG